MIMKVKLEFDSRTFFKTGPQNLVMKKDSDQGPYDVRWYFALVSAIPKQTAYSRVTTPSNFAAYVEKSTYNRDIDLRVLPVSSRFRKGTQNSAGPNF